jgi:hypothetical protein
MARVACSPSKRPAASSSCAGFPLLTLRVRQRTLQCPRPTSGNALPFVTGWSHGGEIIASFYSCPKDRGERKCLGNTRPDRCTILPRSGVICLFRPQATEVGWSFIRKAFQCNSGHRNGKTCHTPNHPQRMDRRPSQSLNPESKRVASDPLTAQQFCRARENNILQLVPGCTYAGDHGILTCCYALRGWTLL